MFTVGKKPWGATLSIPVVTVSDNREASRFEALVEGQTAFLTYERRPGAIVFLHTEVPESLRGRGIGTQLAAIAVQAARAEGLRIIARCPFVQAYLKKHS